MVSIAVVGSGEFIVGFQLAGVKDTIEASRHPVNELRALRQKKGIGVVVIEESVLRSLDHQEQQEIENSVEPVFIPLSTSMQQDSLKRLIKKSIGIELWS
jgi:V/A-type H+-transporting ATPase subunit F